MTTSSQPELQGQPLGRRTRLVQMLIVLSVGFLIPVSVSLLTIFGVRHWQPGIMFMIVHLALGLACLYLVLRRQKRRWLDLGFCLTAPIDEIGHAFALFLGALLLSNVTQALLIPPISSTLGHSPHSFDPAVAVGNHITIFTGICVVLNAFHEELLVRAFLITELEQLYGNVWLAVVASVTLQTSYHLYQGLPAALAHIPTFLLFSVYYVRTRRILPVILAHMLVDVMWLAIFAYRVHRALYG